MVVAASVTAGFVRRRWVLAAYDVRKRFVVTMVMTVWLVYRSSLGTFGVIQPVVRLVVRSRLLRLFVLIVGRVLLLLSCGVVLPIARSACVVFVWVLRLEITDYGVFMTKFVTTNSGVTGCAGTSSTPAVVGTEFAVQFV